MAKQVSQRFLVMTFVCIVLGYIVVANYFASKRFLRVDLTENHIYSITKQTKEVLRTLPRKVTIELYISRDLPPNLQGLKADVRDLVSEFETYSNGKLKVVWRDPQKNPEAQHEAVGLGINSVQMQSINKDKAEVRNGWFGIGIRSGDQGAAIPLVKSPQTLEYDLLKRVVRVSHNETPKVGIFKVDGEASVDPDETEDWGVKNNDGTHRRFAPLFSGIDPEYDLTYVDLTKEPGVIDQSITTLIVPGGDDFFWQRPWLLPALSRYLHQGGNLIVLAPRMWVDFQGHTPAVMRHAPLFDLLTKYGVEVDTALVLDRYCGQIALPKGEGDARRTVPVNYPFLVEVQNEGMNQQIPAVAKLSKLVLPWVSPVRIANLPTGLTADPLFYSSPESYTQGEPLSLQPVNDYSLSFEAAKKRGAFGPSPLGQVVTGQFPLIYPMAGVTAAPGKLVVIGSEHFISAEAGGGPANLPFILNLCDWLTTDESLISIRGRNLVDRSLSQNAIGVPESAAGGIRLLNLITMPLLLSIFGMVLYIRRRTKREKTPVQEVQ